MGQRSISKTGIYRFGTFELDVRAGELRNGGTPVRLAGNAFRALVLLLEHSGELVTRDDLRRALWSPGTFVDFDRNLTSTMNRIRETLHDSAAQPRFIQTVPRAGYRFIAPVERIDRAASPRWIAAGVAAAVVLAAVSIGFFIITRPRPVILTTAPLTSERGLEQHPTFSPDGSRVAFTWAAPADRIAHIFIKAVGADNPVRLTSADAAESAPSWSPDGRWVAFTRAESPQQCAVMVAPPSGGAERRITTVADAGGFASLSWTADSQSLIVPDRSAGSAFALFRLAVETGQKQRLTSPPSTSLGDLTPAVSPSGDTLAFTRGGSRLRDLYIVALRDAAAEPTRLTFDGRHVLFPAWTADGRRLVYTAGTQHADSLWRIRAVAGARPERIAAIADNIAQPIISKARLAYVRYSSKEAHIWGMPLDGGAPRPLIESTYFDTEAQFSPDGRWIAFASSRSGSQQLWICHADGSNARRLTSFPDAEANSPSWSPDGARIVFELTSPAGYEVYTIDASGGVPRRLDLRMANPGTPAYSRDGRALYFTAGGQLWRAALSGNVPDGQPVPIARYGANSVFESADGSRIYFTRGRHPATLWSIPAGGREEVLLASDLSNTENVAVASGGVYYVATAGPGGSYAVKFLPDGARASRTVGRIEGLIGWGIAVSPSERLLLFTRGEYPRSNLMLAECFH